MISRGVAKPVHASLRPRALGALCCSLLLTALAPSPANATSAGLSNGGFSRPFSAAPSHLRVIALSTRLDSNQLHELAEALATSARSAPVLVVAPASTWLTRRPDDHTLMALSQAQPTAGAAIAIQPGGQTRPGAINAAALLFALMSRRFLLGDVDLLPGSDAGFWSLLDRSPLCASPCPRFVAGQPASERRLIALGGQRVTSGSELARALDLGSTTRVDLDSLAAAPPAALQSLIASPATNRPARPARQPSPAASRWESSLAP